MRFVSSVIGYAEIQTNTVGVCCIRIVQQVFRMVDTGFVSRPKVDSIREPECIEDGKVGCYSAT